MLPRMPIAVASSPTGHDDGSDGMPVPPRRRQRYGLLLLSTLGLLAVQGIAAPSGAQQVTVAVLAASSLLLAFRAADLAAREIGVAAGLAIVAVVLSVVHAA